VFFNPSCNHQVCRGCAKGHIESGINSKQFPMRCPGSAECKNELDFETCMIVLDEEFQARLLNLSLNSFAENNGGTVKRCIRPNCDGFVEVEGNLRHCVCPKCDLNWCCECQVDWHIGLTCNQFDNWRKENDHADERTQTLIRTAGWKICPSCKNAVEKSSGCNHMRCRCGNQFCYGCGGPYPCSSGH